MVASVEVRPRRSIAPVLKKVSVDLLTIAQPLGLRRREQRLLPVERLSDRHPLFHRAIATKIAITAPISIAAARGFDMITSIYGDANLRLGR
jgi:hypothetical protein